MRCAWSCVALVLGFALLSARAVVVTESSERSLSSSSTLENISSSGIRACQNKDYLGVKETMDGSCTTECYEFKKAMIQIFKRIETAKKCDKSRSGSAKDSYWDGVRQRLIEDYTCISYDGKSPLLCVNSAIVVELMNEVGKYCIARFHQRGMYRPPIRSETGILACASNQVLPQSDEPTPVLSARLEQQDFEAQVAQRALECVPGDVHGACTGHVWRSPVAVNGECREVCAHQICSADFTFNYCFRMTIGYGITNAECTENSTLRTECFG